MLTIFDRYVARSYLFSLAVFYGTLVGLYLVIDVSGHIAVLFHASGFWGLAPLVVKVYLPRIPLILHELTPFVALLAAMFTVSKMQRDNELLCLTLSGVSIFRVLRPLFVVAVALCLLYVGNREWVIPNLLEHLVQGEDVLESRNPDEVDQFEYRDAQGNDFSIRKYHVFAKKMLGVIITTYYQDEETPERHVPSRRVFASEGHWRRDADGREGWLLSRGKVTFYQRDRTRAPGLPFQFGEDEKGLRILQPGESLESDAEFVSGLRPHQIRTRGEEMQYYGTGKLAEMRQDFPTRAGLAASYHRRFASPVAVIVLLMLGLPFALSGYGSSAFRSIGMGVFLCFVYYVADALCLSMGVGGTLPPAAAAWLPVLVFGPLGLYLLDSVPT